MAGNLDSTLTATLERDRLAIFNTTESRETQNRLWSEHKAQAKAFLADDDAAESAVPQFASSLKSGLSHAFAGRKRALEPLGSHPRIAKDVLATSTHLAPPSNSLAVPSLRRSISNSHRTSPVAIRRPSNLQSTSANRRDTNMPKPSLEGEMVFEPCDFIASRQGADVTVSKRQRLDAFNAEVAPFLSNSPMTDRLALSATSFAPTPTSSFSSSLSPSSYYLSPCSSFNPSFNGGEAMSRQASSTSSLSMTEDLRMLRVESTGLSDLDASIPFPFDQENDFPSLVDSVMSCVTETPSSSTLMQATLGGNDFSLEQGECLKNTGSGFISHDISPISFDVSPSTNLAGNGMPWHSTSAYIDTNNPTAMQRAQSANSTSTTSSTTASQKAASRRRKHIANGAAQPLASKTTHATPTTPSTRLPPKALTTQKHPLPISRLPTKPKTKEPHPCKHCNLILSGAHELQRHTENVHARRKRVWVCRQPASSSIAPLKGLDICKQCKAGKAYNVDYNAAEHLKRGHFSPSRRGRKPKGEVGVAQAAAAAVAKGGSRGPDMKWLKANGWLVEVEVVNEGREVVDEENESRAVDAEEDLNGHVDVDPVSGMVQGVAAFENALCGNFVSSVPVLHATQFLNPIEENICTQVLGLQPNVGFSAFDQDYSLLDNTSADWMAAPMMEHSYSAPGRIRFGH